MSRLRDILLVILIILQFVWGYYFLRYSGYVNELNRRWVYAGERAQIINEIGKPYAVLTVDYGEPPDGFVEGEFYVLKVLKVRATKIDYGFCPVKREVFYQTREKKE